MRPAKPPEFPRRNKYGSGKKKEVALIAYDTYFQLIREPILKTHKRILLDDGHFQPRRGRRVR